LCDGHSVGSVAASEQIPSPSTPAPGACPRAAGKIPSTAGHPSHRTAKIITSANGYAYPPRNPT
jgi:hypothetical protein